MKNFLLILLVALSLCTFSFGQSVLIEADGVFRGHRGAVNSLDVWISKKKGKSLLVSGSDDRRAAVWNLETGENLQYTIAKNAKPDADNAVVFVKFASNGKSVIFAQWWRFVCAWDLKSGAVRNLYGGEGTGKSWVASFIPDVEFSPNGKFCAVVNPPYALKIFALPAFKLVQSRYISDREWIKAVCISPDSRWVFMGGSEKKLEVFSVAENDCVFSEKNTEAEITAICVTPDGKEVLVCDQAGTIIGWDFADGEKIDVATASSPIRCAVVVSESVILCGCEDGFVRFVDFKSGEVFGEKAAHEGPVRCLCVYQPGAFVTGGEDKKIKKWKFTISE